MALSPRGLIGKLKIVSLIFMLITIMMQKQPWILFVLLCWFNVTISLLLVSFTIYELHKSWQNNQTFVTKGIEILLIMLHVVVIVATIVIFAQHKSSNNELKKLQERAKTKSKIITMYGIFFMLHTIIILGKLFASLEDVPGDNGGRRGNGNGDGGGGGGRRGNGGDGNGGDGDGGGGGNNPKKSRGIGTLPNNPNVYTFVQY